MKQIKLLWPVVVALIFLVVALLGLQFVTKSTYAQSSNDIQVVKVLNQTSPVVQVGQFLSFTVYITNNHATFTLTHATLFDDYRQDILGSFGMVGGDPGPTITDSVNGELTWTSLISAPPAAGYFPGLPPGQGISVTMQFQVEHPPAGGFTIVNRAQIRDAIFSSGSVSDTALIDAPTVPITGGNAPITKHLSLLPGLELGVGDWITYTIHLTNDGAAAITDTVVVDTFNPAYLSFVTATPTVPTTIDNVNGIITWTNLATPPILPGQVISLTVVYEILQDNVQITNRAELISAQDFFGNDLAPGFGEVGIIISANTPTPVPQDDTDDDDSPTPVPTSTSIPILTPTPLATSQAITDTSTPLYLPETGWLQTNRFIVPILGLILLIVGWHFFRKFNR
jgi:uncharacterized repeat protein (TIGR01451 family)